MNKTKKRLFFKKIAVCGLISILTCFVFAFKKCPACEHRFNDDNAKNCSRCGKSFARKQKCNSCGYENDISTEYCLECGSKVTASKIVRAEPGKKKIPYKKKKVKKPAPVKELVPEKEVEKESPGELLLKKFAEDYQTGETNDYSFNDLLVLMNQEYKGNWIKEEDLAVDNAINETVIVREDLVKKYELSPLAKFIMKLLKQRLDADKNLLKDLRINLRSKDDDILTSSILLASCIDSLRTSDNFQVLMQNSLSDNNPGVQRTAILIIMKNMPELLLNENTPQLLLSTVNNEKKDVLVRSLFVKAYVQSAQARKELVKELDNKESSLNALKDQAAASTETIDNEIKESIELLEKEIPVLRQSYYELDRIIKEGVEIMDRLRKYGASDKLRDDLTKAVSELNAVNQDSQ